MNFDVTGVGTPMIDFYATSDSSYLNSLNIRPGECVQVDFTLFEELKKVFKVSSNTYVAGSVYNTLSVLGQLNLNVALAVEISRDLYFNDIKRSLETENICYKLGEADRSTGKCLVILNDEKERSFISSVPKANIVKTSHAFYDTKYVLIESYILSFVVDYDLFINQLVQLKARGVKLILGLSDVKVIKEVSLLLRSILSVGMDIVFGNEQEYEEMLSLKGSEELNIKNTLLVITRGKEGVRIIDGEVQSTFKAIETKILDKNGAGDAFAAGFIHGLLLNQNLSSCVQMGQTLSCMVISKMGTKIQITKDYKNAILKAKE